MYKNIWTLIVCFLIEGRSFQTIAGDGDILTSMINNEGYSSEFYEVTTKDGYILSLYRILPTNRTSKVVFAMHGMLASAADLLVLGSGQNKALAYTLSNAGYDVWLGNARGTKFSKRHASITSNDDEYWEFSWNEIGSYDLPAFIDTVLAKTGQQSLHYIGHSQGTTSFFVMLSNLPEYNEKIRSFHAMSPVMRINHPSPFCQFLATNADEIEQTLSMFNINEAPSGTAEVENIASMFCKDDTPFAPLCANFIFAFVGKNPEMFNGTLLGPILKNMPAGSSMRQIYHYFQLMKSKKFQFYDFKNEGNLEKYKSLTPPEYQTSNIRVKTQILYGTHDLMSTPEDTEDLIYYFGNQVVDVVKLDNWNHIDFIYGKEAQKMVYNKIIDVMRKYEL